MRGALGVGVALLLAGAAAAQDAKRQFGPVVTTAGEAEPPDSFAARAVRLPHERETLERPYP